MHFVFGSSMGKTKNFKGRSSNVERYLNSCGREIDISGLIAPNLAAGARLAAKNESSSLDEKTARMHFGRFCDVHTEKNTAQLILTSESVSGALLVDATTRAAMLSFSTPLARELRRALSPGFLCCRNSDVTVVIRRKVVGIDLHIWRPEKFYNSVTLFAVRPIIIVIITRG